MVDFKCTAKDCNQADQVYTFLGDLNVAECGGCGIKLEAFNHRDDPEKVSIWP